MNITIKIFLTLIFILFSFESHANRYWVAKDDGNTHYWDDRANWSDRSGGKGGKPGQWSARKAQMLAKAYKAKGGGYKN